jgi:tripartite-type tricarboxylate transporter receptor subunit TctC
MQKSLKILAAIPLAATVTLIGAQLKPVLAADDYPSKVVQAIVPFGAGGGTDRWARVMSSVGFDVFKSGMRVQNRGGAGGTVGWKYMLEKGADGHSILLASPTPVIAALLEKKPPFDPAKVKIAAYYSVMRPTLMAPKGKPYSTWAGLIKHLKSGGKKVTIGGTIIQTLGPASLLSQLGLVKRVILVTYSGTGKAMNDFLGGHIDMVTVTTSTAITSTDRASIVVNASSMDYPKKAKKVLGNVPNAKTLGLTPFNPPRFIAMHPDTPDAQVAAMSAKLGKMLKSKPVTRLIGKLGEQIIYQPHDKAAASYRQVLKDAKKYLPLFK